MCFWCGNRACTWICSINRLFLRHAKCWNIFAIEFVMFHFPRVLFIFKVFNQFLIKIDFFTKTIIKFTSSHLDLSFILLFPTFLHTLILFLKFPLKSKSKHINLNERIKLSSFSFPNFYFSIHFTFLPPAIIIIIMMHDPAAKTWSKANKVDKRKSNKNDAYG